MGTDPNTAAHHDAVHQRHIRLGVAADVGVEAILVAAEPPRLDPVGAGAVIDRDYVAAGAQAPLAGAGQHHRVHVVVVLPIPQHLVQGGDHRMCQRVDRLRPVQGSESRHHRRREPGSHRCGAVWNARFELYAHSAHSTVWQV
jgi:hypothetical protein